MKICKRIDDKFTNAKETDWIRKGFTDDEVEKICNQAREDVKRERRRIRMQIVVEVTNELYDEIKNGIYDGNTREMAIAIGNGIILPKGHGDLIDRSETLRTDRFSDGHEGLRTIQEYAVYAKIRRYLQSLPAIIPAEKE